MACAPYKFRDFEERCPSGGALMPSDLYAPPFTLLRRRYAQIGLCWRRETLLAPLFIFK